MLVRDWMTTEVVTVTPETPMPEASKLLKEHDIRRVPVVDKQGRLRGVVSRGDVKAASPSKATTLDVHEIYYLIESIRCKDIMTSPAFSVSLTDTVESAAMFMREKHIGCMPVVDEHEKVVGVITDSDILDVLIAITGARHGGVQMGFKLPNTPGTLKAVVDDLRSHQARIMSILTNIDDVDAMTRHVYVRIHPMPRSEENALVETLQANHAMVYWAREKVHPLV